MGIEIGRCNQSADNSETVKVGRRCCPQASICGQEKEHVAMNLLSSGSPGAAVSRVKLVAVAASVGFTPVLAQEGAPEESRPPENVEFEDEVAKGILPQLGILLRIPEDFRLYDPEDPKPPEEEIEYERTFPFGAEAAIKRGYSLPLPIGISAIYVSIKPEQDLEGDVYLWQSHMAATGQ
jgi:hypothetical protein